MDLTLPVPAPPPTASPPPPWSPQPVPSAAPMSTVALVFAACGPVAIGALVAARTGTTVPVAAVPAVVFGVVAATSPALYIASAATGTAPPLPDMARALVAALGAFGVALAGLLLPATFLALSAVAPTTAFAVATGTIACAALLGLRRLANELRPRHAPPSLAASTVFAVWWLATFGIAGRLWWDLAREVVS